MLPTYELPFLMVHEIALYFTSGNADTERNEFSEGCAPVCRDEGRDEELFKFSSPRSFEFSAFFRSNRSDRSTRCRVFPRRSICHYLRVFAGSLGSIELKRVAGIDSFAADSWLGWRWWKNGFQWRNNFDGPTIGGRSAGCVER